MSQPRYVVLEKPMGQTPLEAIAVWKVEHPDYSSLPATYAGRLDPLASGKLLVLLGGECAKREQYLGLDKEYVIEVFLGASTDTGDALGLASIDDEAVQPPGRSDLSRALRRLTGTHTVPYPAFSSKTVNGIPLFQYALEGTLDRIVLPTHEETVYKARVERVERLPSPELLERIRAMLRRVPRSDEPSKAFGADFRQDAIRARWQELLGASDQSFPLVALRVTCASGTYMRTLAGRLARELGTSGFALSIRRTRIGHYQALGPFGFWKKQY